MTTRTEFGVERSSCACEACVINCRHMPGFLLPADLDRMTATVADVLAWAERNLLASPGALVMNTATGRTFRIPTLVPAIRPDGSCIHLTADQRCGIHAIAPFGCAFFSCQPEHPGLARDGMTAVRDAWDSGRSLYGKVWRHLWEMGKRQERPDVLRARMGQVI